MFDRKGIQSRLEFLADCKVTAFVRRNFFPVERHIRLRVGGALEGDGLFLCRKGQLRRLCDSELREHPLLVDLVV